MNRCIFKNFSQLKTPASIEPLLSTDQQKTPVITRHMFKAIAGGVYMIVALLLSS